MSLKEQNMSKRVLLTGASGSIGAQFIIHFMENTDWEIVALDSFRHKGYRDRLVRIYVDHPEWKSRIHEFQHDLVCPISPELQASMGPVDIILHLAALSDVFFSVENPVYVVKNNVDSTLTMLEYARAVKPEAFLYFSTDEVYGPVTWGECTDGKCDDWNTEEATAHKHLVGHKEGEAHRPSNAYAASKAASESICRAWWRSYDVPLIITNTMNNFGEMQSSSKFPAIIQNKIERGEKITIHGNDKEIGTRFYIHSRNVADAVIHILSKPVHHHDIGQLDEPDQYHIVGAKPLDNLQLAKTIARLMGADFEYELQDFHRDNPAHDIHYGLQDNKLRPAGWKQPMSDDESFKQTIEWQKQNEEWMRT
jgi:dTDP-glucose 4,6-dehydratase